MGIADVIPGVSGGTMAFITGIYPRLISSISKVDYLSFLKGRFKKGLKSVDFSLFVPLGLGIVTAILLLSSLITSLLDSFPGQTFALFFGLILASAYVIWKVTRKMQKEHLIIVGLGFVVAYLITGLTTTYSNHSLPFIFIAGAIAICAMLLPGISGAFLLLVLNQYAFLLNALHTKDLLVVVTFILGAFAGLFLFAKLLNYLLKNYKTFLFSFLIGIMLGALRLPLQEIRVSNVSYLSMGLFALIGFVIVVVLEKVGVDKK